MQISYSRVSTFKKCPYQYRLRYREEIKTIPTDDPQSALILGHALHTGIERDVQAAIEEYYSAYPIISDKHIDEAIKLEYLIPKIKARLPTGEHEVKIENEDFKGFIDLLVHVGDCYDIYDFKYSNNVKSYMDSAQLHLYKYYFELLNPGKKIRSLYFVFIPKVQIRRKLKNKTNPRDETDYEFRQRIMSELKTKEIQTIEVEYDPNKVIEFLMDVKHLTEAEDFDKNPTHLCDWCEYQIYCKEGLDYMNLPKNERRSLETSGRKKIWVYGPPFSGKTTLADKFPDPLILTTDGNIRNVTAPYIHIKDAVTTEGRMTKRNLAWEIFKETIAELEKKQNDFKTIVVDLLEDTYEYCRLYMYRELNISHESDDSFRAWDKVRTEYLSVLRRLMNLDYENIILISHEDTSKDITKKSGDKTTTIKPNINDKCANKVAGMVDLVARVIVNDDDSRMLSFKADNIIFGGGRLGVKGKEIPLDYDALMDVYGEAIKADTKSEVKGEQPGNPGVGDAENKTVKTASPSEETPRRKRRIREEAAEENNTEQQSEDQPAEDIPAEEEKPVRRRRRRSE